MVAPRLAGPGVAVPAGRSPAARAMVGGGMLVLRADSAYYGHDVITAAGRVLAGSGWRTSPRAGTTRAFWVYDPLITSGWTVDSG
jgi:hypothetical protein